MLVQIGSSWKEEGVLRVEGGEKDRGFEKLDLQARKFAVSDGKRNWRGVHLPEHIG